MRSRFPYSVSNPTPQPIHRSTCFASTGLGAQRPTSSLGIAFAASTSAGMATTDIENAITVPLPLSPAPIHAEGPSSLLAHASAVTDDSGQLTGSEDPGSNVRHGPSTAEGSSTGDAIPGHDAVNSYGKPRGPSAHSVPIVVPPEITGLRNEESQTPVTATPPTPPSKAGRRPSAIEVASQKRRTSSPRSGTPVDSRTNGHLSSRSSTPGLSSPNLTSPPAHKRSLTMSRGNTVSTVLILTALETIAASREAKRSTPLKDSVQRALEMVRAGQGGDRPREIFEPLRLACETRNEKLMIASLDCISKLISYSFFVEPDTGVHQFASPPTSPGFRQSAASSETSLSQPSLVDIVVHTVTSCHSETTADTVSLQIVKALLSLVLSANILVHQSSLLKAVRTVYNVFLLSTDPVTQTVAQGGLTQMVHHVFTRCKISFENGEDDELRAVTSSSSLSESLAVPSIPSNLQGTEETKKSEEITAKIVAEISADSTASLPLSEDPQANRAPRENGDSHVHSNGTNGSEYPDPP